MHLVERPRITLSAVHRCWFLYTVDRNAANCTSLSCVGISTQFVRIFSYRLLPHPYYRLPKSHKTQSNLSICNSAGKYLQFITDRWLSTMQQSHALWRTRRPINVHYVLPRYCSSSNMFVSYNVPNCQAVIRNSVYRCIVRIDNNKSHNSLLCAIRSTDIRWLSRMRRHWLSMLYVHFRDHTDTMILYYLFLFTSNLAVLWFFSCIFFFYVPLYCSWMSTLLVSEMN